MVKLNFFITILLFPIFMISQEHTEELPFREISEYPDNYSAELVAARLIEGLGFRFYWATEGIRLEDLDYKPSEDSRTYGETVDHINNLVSILNSTVSNEPFKPQTQSNAFQDRRKTILNNLKMAVDKLKNGGYLTEMKTIFQTSNGEREIPFWNQINGPISDAIWHCGQLVVLRRSSGNPLPEGPDFFNGKLRQ